MISLGKINFFDTLQEFVKNVGDLGKLIFATGFEKLPKVQKSPDLVTLILSHHDVSIIFKRDGNE